jgi:hypothetical protein
MRRTLTERGRDILGVAETCWARPRHVGRGRDMLGAAETCWAGPRRAEERVAVDPGSATKACLPAPKVLLIGAAESEQMTTTAAQDVIGRREVVHSHQGLS